VSHDEGEEARLVRRVREDGDAAALGALRSFWLRTAALNDALASLVDGSLVGAAGAIVTGRVVLMWFAPEKRWTIVRFDHEPPAT
jgi:hypothetical protein